MQNVHSAMKFMLTLITQCKSNGTEKSLLFKIHFITLIYAKYLHPGFIHFEGRGGT